MSILIAPTRYVPHVGGIETLLRHTLPLLREQGYEPVIVTEVDDDGPAASVVDGVPVYRLPFVAAARSPDPTAILDVTGRLRDIEARHGVKLRHVHGLDFNTFFVWRRHQRAPLPLVISVHGTIEEPALFNRVTKRMLATADVVTTVSKGVRASVAATVPKLDLDRVQIIPNAIEAPSGSPPWPPTGHLFAAGRLQDQKGFDVAIEALGRLAGRHPSLSLHLAGTGEEAHNLRTQAQRLGIASRVRFLGSLPRDEILREISHASMVLVPSRTIEGFSLVALEAAHLGRPVVATRVGGLPETIEDGLTGLLVPPDDADALAAAVDRLLADPMRTNDMCERARRRAVQFDIVSCACAYADIYRSLGHEGLDSVVLRCAPGIVHERLDNEVVAIDLERGMYYAMANTAVDVWRSFEHPATLGGVARRLARRYRAPLEAVRADVIRFTFRLEREGLLARAATVDGSRGPDGAEPVGRRWEAPVVEAYDDMAHLLIREPGLLVDEAGWPRLPEPAR
jgi:glycosyltransferase involved in cell wall biosynthesis